MDRRRDAADGIRRFAIRAGLTLTLAVSAAISAPAALAAEETPARLLFGKLENPSDSDARVIGSYAKGCLDGGERLEDVGPGYQTMRPSRNRAWGHPKLLEFLRKLAADVVAEKHAPLLVGDLAQPRGGPMLSGHASHQSGLDVDIWFRPSPPTKLTRKQREEWSAYSVVKSVKKPWVTDKFTERERRLIELAARHPDTERIFVAAPIKKALCEAAPEEDRVWLRKVRPWYGHKDHLHVRLACPSVVDRTCKPQSPPPPGDGCGEELASWLKPPKPPPPSAKPAKPKKPRKKKEILLSQLPEACAAVLGADPKL